jgi:hypothetical protein
MPAVGNSTAAVVVVAFTAAEAAAECMVAADYC